MAKRKTPKASKTKFISKEHLEKAQAITQNISAAQTQVGMLEVRKQVVLNSINEMHSILRELRTIVKEEYGTDDFDLSTGAING